MRTKTATLITAEKSATSTPYISVTLTGSSTYTYATTDSPNKIKLVRHTEEPYNDFAVVVLGNSAKTLPANLIGYRCDISYGYRVSGVNYQTTPTSCAPLWVKRQYQTSKQGDVDMVLYLEGAWTVLSETEYIASLIAAAAAPYYDIDYSAASYTPYDIIEAILAGVGFDLAALGIHDDSIIDTLIPKFMVNYQGNIEAARDVIYRLLNMTRCFMRVESNAITVPSVDNPTNGQSGFPSQNKVFYSLGLYWSVFYHTNSGLYYMTSATGVDGTWSSPVELRAASGISLYQWDCFVETRGAVTYFHWTGGSTGAVVYRRGEMQSDGTITNWVAEQTVETTETGFSIRSLAVSPDGYPCVSYSQNYGSIHLHLHVCANNDGTWATAENLTVAGSYTWWSKVVPLTGNKFVAVYARAQDNDLCARTYNGSWGAEVNSGYHSAAANMGEQFDAYTVGSTVHVVYCCADSPYDLKHATFTAGAWSAATIISAAVGLYSSPAITKDSLGNLYAFWIQSNEHMYCSKYSTSWGATIDVMTIDDLATSNPHNQWNIFDILPNDTMKFVYTDHTAHPNYRVKFVGATAYPISLLTSVATFRIIYPNAWTSYHNTFTSDRPDATYHQFKEFEWQDHILLPTHVIVVANRVDKADGTWDETEIKLGDFSITPEGGYPTILQYHLAESLTTTAAANTRASAIAIRQHMEAALGRVLVQHDCGLELYDYVQVRDKRGVAGYTDYPTTKWISTYTYKMCVVGCLVHTFQADAGIYSLEITLNGITSERPLYEVAKAKSIETGVIGDWGFIGGVGEGGPLPGTSQVQPFKPVLEPAKYGGASAVWNAMLDLATSGAKVRNDITVQAIDWARKAVENQQRAALTEYLKQVEAGKGFSLTPEQVARLGLGVAGAAPKPTPTTSPVATPNPLLKQPGENMFQWLLRVGRSQSK